MSESNNARERDNSVGFIAEVIETKLDQLIESVKEIKDQMHDNSVDISNIKLELNTFKNKTEQQQKEIDELKETNKGVFKWIGGIVASIILAVIAFAARRLIGM